MRTYYKKIVKYVPVKKKSNKSRGRKNYRRW